MQRFSRNRNLVTGQWCTAITIMIGNSKQKAKFRNYILALFFAYFTHLLFAQQPVSPLVSSFHEYLKMKKETVYNLDWISLGPVINSARVESVQLDPNDPGTMYVAFGSGNLWKTVNNGLSWKPIFDDQPAQGIGDIALAPSDTKIIYLGTGESLKKPRNFTMPGTGVYRSDDSGETWKHLGLDDSWHIGEIAVHPTNPDIAIVAVLGHFWSTNENRGLYRTENGGKSWEHVLYIDDKTGANDVVFSYSDPDIVFASMWENNPGVSGSGSGIYNSKDGGLTWVKSDSGLPEGPDKGRIGLAISYSDPDKVYALIDHRNREEDNGAAEVYKSLDGGKSWQRTHQEELMIFSVIGWYFTDIYVNPQNDEEIFGLGVRLAHSADGGKTFDLIGGDIYHLFPSVAATLHLDHCELWINPLNPNHLALGNDGGFYVSYDKGKKWTHFNNIPAGEFYDITVDNQEPYKVYGGVQDDATVYGMANEWNDKFTDNWKYLWIDAWSGGDGCFTYVDPVDPNTVYFSLQNGAVRRKDMAADTSISIRPKLPENHQGDLRFNFVAPYLLSHHDHKTLYHSGNYVFKSTDQGDNWTVISEDLSISSDSLKNSHASGALAESPLKPGLLYMGTDKGALWVSKDDGKSWQENSKGLPNAYVRSIYPSQFKESRVYLALTGINYDDLNTYLYKSENYGKKWEPIMNNLPNEVANVIIEDPMYENILFAGLLRGVYISTDRGKSWSLLGNNMPAVSISDLEIQQNTQDLIVATHGRGIYKLNLKPLHEAEELNLENDHLFSIPKAMRPYFNDTHNDPDYSTVKKAPFTFWSVDPGLVTINVTDQKDSILWSTEFEAKYGFNQIRWDLITKKNKSPLPYFVQYNEFIKPGNFKLVINNSRIKLEGRLEVISGRKKK